MEKIRGTKPMKELRVDNITKTYGEKVLFDDLSFMIHEQDRIGLIGVNGTGKSSLLKIIAEKDSGEKGSIQKPQDYRVGYLTQETEFDENMTVAQAVFTGESPVFQAVRDYEMALLDLATDGSNPKVQQAYTQAEEKMNKEDGWLLDTNAKAILNRLGISDVTKLIKELSGGQKKRVGLAQILIQEPDLLLLDEPTNHLDYQAINWLAGFLKQYKGAFVVITHDRYFLDQVTNRIFELSFGKLYEYEGNYQSYIAAKAEREEREKTQEHKRKQMYKQELAWMRAGVQARGTKQQARIDRFHDLEKNLNQVKEQDSVELSFGMQRLGKKVMMMEKGQLSIADQLILDQFELLVQAGDRIGITGKNGSGKTTLLNVLAGRKELDQGVYEIGETVKLAYYTQQNEEMDPNQRMIAYLQEAAEEVTTASGEKISVTEMLERFLFPRFMHGTLIGKLSGGEKRRLYLLKLLIGNPNVLLLDEPTNDLDIDTLTVLEDYLGQFAGTVIAVSHDRYFLDKTMDKLLIFKGDGVIEPYLGSITDYLADKEQEEEAVKVTKVSKAVEEVPSAPKETVKTKLTYMEKKEWATIEDEISQLEQQIEELTEGMNGQGSDFVKLQELQDAVSQTEKQLEEKMDRWEYLSQFADE